MVFVINFSDISNLEIYRWGPENCYRAEVTLTSGETGSCTHKFPDTAIEGALMFARGRKANNSDGN